MVLTLPPRLIPFLILEGPLLTTTTINVVKLIGQYMNMMKTLPNIATEVFQGIVQVRPFSSLDSLFPFL